ncbi:type II secretion system secretin GspD [Teredinibacter turnerae]|uniref:type II secretion system secretin GspD n=1 Tax=Teredinibacter turnerae TaxID=2426 RepID=UPI0003824517|nr:type II secretion system secretin GspD [Teredinibacter turnerae]
MVGKTVLKHFRVILCMTIVFCASSGWAQQQTWTVNFKDSDINEVIKFVAEVTGKTMVIDPRVKGRVKVISQKPLNERELIELFRSVLEVHDFTLVEVGNVVRIVPLKDARSSPLPVKDDADIDEGYITQVIQLKNIAAAKVLPVLRPLVPQHSHLAAYDPSNAIVVSDTAANIERIKEVIEKIDTAAMPVTEVIELKYADSESLVATLAKLDGANKQGNSANQITMVADKRNNAILLSGEDLQRQRVKQLIRRLDRPQLQTGNVRVVYLEYATAKDVATVLSKVVQNMAKMTPGGDKGAARQGATVEADEATNSLLITAEGDQLDAIMAVVDRLDIRRAQVLVEAIIVEMTLGDKESLGIDWMFKNATQGLIGASTAGGTGAAGVAAALFGGAEDAAAQLLTALGGSDGQTLGVAGESGGEDFLVLVNMLQSNSNANILSTPTLLTMDNNEAMISVGQNVPFVTGSFTNTGGNGGTSPFQTIQRQDVGITLTVTPHVNEGDKVILDIQQEISSVVEEAGAASDVITEQRKVETQVMAKDRSVIVLGGLIRDEMQRSENRVPVLGSIPVMGRLFRSNSETLRKSNLMIFIRPTIIRDDETLEGATAEKYTYIRDLQRMQSGERPLKITPEMLQMLPELESANLHLPEEGTTSLMTNGNNNDE